MRILLIDDQEIYRAAISDILKTLVPDCILKVATSEETARAELSVNPPFDFVILDLVLGTAVCYPLLSEIIELNKDTKVIAISGDQKYDVLHELARHGAWSFLPKTYDMVDFKTFIYTMLVRGRPYWPGCPVPYMQKADREYWHMDLEPLKKMMTDLGYDHDVEKCRQLIDTLSEQQFKVVQMVTKGNESKEIARELSISEGVVKKHLAKSYLLLNTKNRAQASAVFFAGQIGNYYANHSRRREQTVEP